MPAISITDDQRERLRWIQTRLAEDVEYGHVRPRDALEYLLDRFDEDDEAVALGGSGEASTSDSPPAPEPTPPSESIPPSTGTADDSTEFVVMNGGGGVTGRRTSLGGTDSVDEGNDGDTPDGDDAVDDETTDGNGTDDEATDDARHEAADDGDAADDVGDGEPTDDADEPSDAGDVDDDSDSESGDGERLNAVMNLLVDHDGKWRETGGGEEKYEVDLPDGDTERARTKVDVRAVLFRHYR